MYLVTAPCGPETGTLTALNETFARERLAKLGYKQVDSLVEVDETSLPPRELVPKPTPEPRPSFLETAAGVARAAFQQDSPAVRRRVSLDSLAMFTLHLKTMLDAGISILPALQTLADSNDWGAHLAKRVSEGNRLSKAMSELPHVFDVVYVSMTRAGEETGSLTSILGLMADALEYRRRSRARLTQALIYPCALVIAAVAMVIFLVGYMLPRFVSVFANLGGQLPWPTQVVLWFSHRPEPRWLALLAVILAMGMARLAVTRPKAPAVQWLWFRSPVLGGVNRKLAVAGLCRGLVSILGSGIPVPTALRLSVGTTGYVALDDSLQSILQLLMDGASLAEAVEDAQELSPILRTAIGCADGLGQLPQALGRIPPLLEEEAANACGTLISVIETGVLIALGVVIGFIVVACFLPVLQIGMAF